MINKIGLIGGGFIGMEMTAFGKGKSDFAETGLIGKLALVDDDYDKALDRAASTLQMIYNRPFRDAARKYCLLGRPADFLEQMQAFARSGARHFVFSMLSDPAEFIDAFEKEIRPGLAQIEL